MKLQHLIKTLTIIGIITIGITGLNGAVHKKSLICHNSLEQLNKSMQNELHLTSKQMDNIFELNHDYIRSRKDILNVSHKIGQHTAVLACWDHWRQSLEDELTESQMETFMQWQSQVDILSTKPF